MRWALITLLVISWFPGDAQAVTGEQINDAIARMQAYLLDQQDAATGGWEDRYTNSRVHRGGESALVMLALLHSGVSIQDPRMLAGATFLDGVTMGGTYAVSLRTHCWAALPDEYRPRLSRDARWLLRAQDQGLFDYGVRAGPRYDHSVTQYGLLGLWESSKRSGPSSGRVWIDTVRHFLEAQNEDGGWGYQADGGSTPSMTAAGLTALLIAQERLYRSQHKPPARVADAIDRGIDWLDRDTRSSGVRIGSRWGMYYLVSLERVALASGVKAFADKDWFEQGTQAILDRERGTGSLGSNRVDTAFALFFLARGRVPVWINKLRLHGSNWNNRPNDLNLLTRKLSDLFEQELNWQVVDIHSNPNTWLNAPVAYLASDTPPVFSSTALANLKTYLDLGGVLVASPEASPDAFIETIEQTAKRLYPQYTFRRSQPDHPLLSLVYPVKLPEKQRPLVLSNGVRDLIIIAPTDWGMSLQSGQLERPTVVGKMMTNLHALVTDRGRVGNRMDSPFVLRNRGEATSTVRVVRHSLSTNPAVEPKAWEPMRDRFFNRTGMDLQIRNLPLEQAQASGATLIHLGGVDAQRLSPKRLRALVRFINKGGTVLVETIGGRGDYASSLKAQLSAVFDSPARLIASDHPILTGTGLAGGYDNRQTGYRRFTVLKMGLVSSPRLESIEVSGRSAVIISQEDLSLGVLGARRWGVNGYDADSARGLLTNTLLYAVQSAKTFQANHPTPQPAQSLSDAP